MSKTANRVLSMVIAVTMLLSSMAVFAVADTAELFVDAYDGTVIPNTALLVDSTITAAEVESGATVSRKWDGKMYLFTGGVNAFSSFTEAYAYANADGNERPAIIVTGWGETTEVVISMASDVYAPNWNTVPMNEMSDDFDAIASNGADWTPNPDFAANELKIGTITVNGDVQGSASIHGFTLTKFIQHDTKRTDTSTKFEFLIKNSKMSGVSTTGNILKKTGNTSTTNEDKITFKNFWLDTIGGTSTSNSRFFGDNTRHSSHIEFDGLYVDMSKASFLKTNDHLKAYAENTSLTFKNSNLRKSANSTNPYWNIAQMNKSDITEYTRTLTFENNVMYNWTNGSPVINNNAVSAKGPNNIVVKDNYVINTYAARNLFANANNATVTGNVLLGINDQTITDGSASDNFLVTSVLTSAEEYAAATGSPYSGSESFYVDSAMTISGADFTETFNEKLAAGLNINNVAFTAADTAVVVATAKTTTIGSDKVAFLTFGGEIYKFVVDGVNVFDVATGSDLSTVTGLAGKTNIILPTGNYGNLTLLPTSANYYGSNFGVDPIDKSGATLENNYDWALSENWDLSNETEIRRLSVPAAAAGTILVDGITVIRDIADQERLVTNESLNFTVQNIVHDASASDTTAVFYMHNGRSTNATDAENGAKNADLTTIKNYYVKNHTSRQFLHEVLNANVVIDNLYWNTEITGQQRSTLGFLKHGSAVANTSLTIKNSNLRVSPEDKTSGYAPIMLYEQYGLDVTIENNIFVQNRAGLSSPAIYTAKNADTCHFGDVKISDNLFIATVEGAYIFASNGSVGFYDVASSEIDNNTFVGYVGNNVAMGGLPLTNTFISSDKNAAAKADENLGLYSAAMKENPYYLDYNKNYLNTGLNVTDATVTNGDATVVDKEVIFAINGTPEETITGANFVTGENGGQTVTVTLATDSKFENVIEGYDLTTLDGAAKLYAKVAYTDKIYDTYTVSILDASLASFNDMLATKNDAEEEIGVTINNVTFKASDTAVYLPKDATILTVDGKQVTYLTFFGTNYKFVIDGVNVFANNGSDLSALAAFQGKKIVLPAGEYGEIKATFAADFYGSNFGVNPSNKSGAKAANMFEWTFNSAWKKASASVLAKIEVPAGVTGEDLSFDGVIFSRYDDDNRLLTDGALYTQLKNSVIVNGGMGNGNATIFTNNKRTLNFTDEAIADLNKDSILLKNVYVESVGSNQLFHEYNVPNVTIDGLYLDGTKAGKGRPALSFFKSSYLHDSNIVIKNSNIRNGGTTGGKTNLFTFSGALSEATTTGYTVGAAMSVEITGNYIVDGQNSANAIFVPNVSSVGSFVVDGNTIISTSGESLFTTDNHGGATDETSPLIGNVVFNNNRIMGFAASKVDMASKWGTFTKTYYSTTVDGLDDANALTGSYHEVMGENYCYLDYNKNYINTGVDVEEVAAEHTSASTSDDVITLTVDGTPDYAITADTFVTGDAAGKVIVKTLATDAACKNTIDSYNYKDLVGSATLYLKVMYKANEKIAKTYTIKLYDSAVESFNAKLQEGLTIDAYDLTAENTAVYLPKEAEVIDGATYLEFAGDLYKFVVDGVNVFANDAFASIEKEYIVLPTGTYGDLTVARAATFIGSNVGINPSDDRNASHTNGYDWTINADWDMEKSSVIGKVTVPTGVVGDTLTFDGVTMSMYDDDARLLTDGSLYTSIMNTMFVNAGDATAVFYTNNARSTNSTDVEAGLNNDDSIELYNVYFKSVNSNQLFHEVNVPYLTMDGVYLDATAAGKKRSSLAFFKWGTKITDIAITIVNSNFRNGSDANPFLDINARGYQYKNEETGSWPWAYEGGEPVATVVIDNNIFYNAQGGTGATNTFNIDYATVGVLDFTNNTVIDTKGYAKLFNFDDNAGVGEEGNVLYGNVTVDGNNFIGFKAAKASFDVNYGEFTNTYYAQTTAGLVNPEAVTGEYHEAMGSNGYYLDLARNYSTESGLDSFNEALTNGVDINGTEFSDVDSVVVVPQNFDGYYYGALAGAAYMFEVDNEIVFDSFESALAAIDAGTNVILPAGNYGAFNVTKAVNIIGSNFGINPVDKSTATAENFFDWSFNEEWNEVESTNLDKVEILSGIDGDALYFDGVKLTKNLYDTKRTTAEGDLVIEFVNSVVDVPAPANGNAVFCMRSSRSEKNAEVGFGSAYADQIALRDTYIKTAKCNQLFDEYNPNILMDGVYLDSTKAQRGRSILSFFKIAPANNVIIEVVNSNIRNGVGANSLFTLTANASSSSSMAVYIENNIFYNSQGNTNALFAINNTVTELSVVGNTFISGDIKNKLIAGYSSYANGNITLDGNRFAGYTAANLDFSALGYTGLELTNTYYSPNLTGLAAPADRTGEYHPSMGYSTYYFDFDMNIAASETQTFVEGYEGTVISNEALLVDTTITEDEMATATDIVRNWEGQAYKFTTGTNAFSTLEAAFAKAVELGIECPDIIVTSYDMSNGVGGETSPAVSNQNMNITMPCNIYGRKWNIAPMNEMNDDFNALESENKDWTLNTQFVSTVDTIIPDDVTSVNHIFISSAVNGNVKFAGLRVLDQLHFGGLSGEAKRTAESGDINITVENTLLQIKPGKTWGGAVIDTIYDGGNPGATNNDSLTFKNVWFKNIRKTELCGQEVVPSTFVLDSVHMAMDHFTAHTFIKGNGTNVKQIYKDSYFAINEDDTCFVFGAGTSGIDKANVESAELVFDNNVFNNYNDMNTNGMMDIEPSAYTSIKFTNNFVYNTEDTPKSLFSARGNFGDNVEISGNTILGFRADNTLTSKVATATIDAKENFIVTKVCETLDEYKAEVGSGFKATTTYVDGAQTFYYDYAREYINSGKFVTGVTADVSSALIEEGEISLSVDGSSQALTADSFTTANATKPVVKTLATDADFANVIDEFDLASDSTTLYLKVAYADTAYPETVYAITIFNDAGIPVFTDALAEGLTINGVTFTKADTAVYLPASTAMVGDVTYLDIAGTEYKVVVGENASKDLTALSGKKNILLVAGNYGDLNVAFAANFYGTNMNVNPFDKTGAAPSNNYDWALNDEWDMENVSLIEEIVIPADVKGGELVIDGVKFATYIDATRTLESEALYTTIKNSVLNNTIAGTAPIHTDNIRAMNVTDTTFGASYDDSFTLKDVYVEKTTSNQLLDEWNVPFVTIDGVYLDGEAAGKNRPILSFFKTTTQTKGKITINNNNFRNAGTKNGASPLITVTGAVDRRYDAEGKLESQLFPCVDAVELEVNNNTIYNNNARVLNIYLHSISKVDFNNNIVIDETGEQGFLTSEIMPKDVAGNQREKTKEGDYETAVAKRYLALYAGEGVTIDNNMFVGLNPDKMSSSIGLEEKNPEYTNTYYSSTVEGLADATAKTGEYTYCMYDNDYYVTYDKKVTGADLKLNGVSAGTSDATVRKYYEKTKSVEIRLGESGTTAGVVFSISNNATGTFVDAEGNYVDAVTTPGSHTYRVYSNVYEDVYEDYTVVIPGEVTPEEPDEPDVPVVPDDPEEPVGPTVAVIGDVEYDSVEDAINAATPGQTIKLTADTTAGNIVVTPGVTLDLNGKKLTAERVLGLKGSTIIDTYSEVDRVVNSTYNVNGSTKTGGIYAPKANVILSNESSRDETASNVNNHKYVSYIPVYDAQEECYKFIWAEMRDGQMTVTGSNFQFMPIIGYDAAERNGIQKDLFATDNLAEAGVSIGIRVTWVTDDYTASQEFTMADNTVKDFINGFGYVNSGRFTNNYKQKLGASFTGEALKQADYVYISAIIVSNTGVELESKITEVDTTTLG